MDDEFTYNIDNWTNIDYDLIKELNRLTNICFSSSLSRHSFDNNYFVLYCTNNKDNHVLFYLIIEKQNKIITLWNVCSSESGKGYLKKAIKYLYFNFIIKYDIQKILLNVEKDIKNKTTFIDRLLIYYKLGFNTIPLFYPIYDKYGKINKLLINNIYYDIIDNIKIQKAFLNKYPVMFITRSNLDKIYNNKQSGAGQTYIDNRILIGSLLTLLFLLFLLYIYFD
jgi:hypothetical protein